MNLLRRLAFTALTACCLFETPPPVGAQELPLSGAYGLTFVWTTSPGGTSQLIWIDPTMSWAPVAVGGAVPNVPSRWAHRRRILGALETRVAYAQPLVLMTPLGDAPGSGAIHLMDGRTGYPPATAVVATGNPACYDLAVAESTAYVFSAEDGGLGTTLLRGFSYQAFGQLTPLSPATLSIPGAPAAYVSRMGLDEPGGTLHVPTTAGIQVVSFSSGPTQMGLGPFISTAPAVPCTNPVAFDRNGTQTWIVGTSGFQGSSPVNAGFMTWTDAGVTEVGGFGLVPGAPGKSWVPAAGAEEMALVGNGTDTYAYCLLREPGPGTFYVKPAAVGVVRFLGSATGVSGTLPCPDICGEPFANPTVSGTRVAFESSFGPPFIYEPVNGGEKVNIIYTPLDPLGSGSAQGVLVAPGPLAGRISTKGMDRPLWDGLGSRVFASTSWFPGAPSPSLPGLEALDVPATVPLNEYVSPHTVVPLPTFPDQSVLFPSVFRPRFPIPSNWLGNSTVLGGGFNDGLRAALSFTYGELGLQDLVSPAIALSNQVPNFPSILPPSFDDAGTSTVPIPGTFGARRTTFNIYQDYGLMGLVMFAADGDSILLQPTGYGMYAAFGLLPPLGVLRLPLPSGWITSSEFLSI